METIETTQEQNIDVINVKAIEMRGDGTGLSWHSSAWRRKDFRLFYIESSMMPDFAEVSQYAKVLDPLEAMVMDARDKNDFALFIPEQEPYWRIRVMLFGHKRGEWSEVAIRGNE